MTFPKRFARAASALSSRYGGPYYRAQRIVQTPPVTNAGGSIITPGDIERTDCQAQVVASEAMRRQLGYTDKDVQILVLGLDSLDTDAVVEVLDGPHIGTWTIQAVDRDPVGVGFVCKGRRRA